LKTHLAEHGVTSLVVERLADLRDLPACRQRLLDEVVAARLELEGMAFEQHDLLDRQLARLVLVMTFSPDQD
jgi:hypothetical protein